jgi:hypothetical protein
LSVIARLAGCICVAALLTGPATARGRVRPEKLSAAIRLAVAAVRAT